MCQSVRASDLSCFAERDCCHAARREERCCRASAHRLFVPECPQSPAARKADCSQAPVLVGKVCLGSRAKGGSSVCVHSTQGALGNPWHGYDVLRASGYMILTADGDICFRGKIEPGGGVG